MIEKDNIDDDRIKLAEAWHKASEAVRAFNEAIEKYFPLYKSLNQTEEE